MRGSSSSQGLPWARSSGTLQNKVSQMWMVPLSRQQQGSQEAPGSPSPTCATPPWALVLLQWHWGRGSWPLGLT